LCVFKFLLIFEAQKADFQYDVELVLGYPAGYGCPSVPGSLHKRQVAGSIYFTQTLIISVRFCISVEKRHLTPYILHSFPVSGVHTPSYILISRDPTSSPSAGL
jgi:hypothetical protein